MPEAIEAMVDTGRGAAAGTGLVNNAAGNLARAEELSAAAVDAMVGIVLRGFA